MNPDDIFGTDHFIRENTAADTACSSLSSEALGVSLARACWETIPWDMEKTSIDWKFPSDTLTFRTTIKVRFLIMDGRPEAENKPILWERGTSWNQKDRDIPNYVVESTFWQQSMDAEIQNRTARSINEMLNETLRTAVRSQQMDWFIRGPSVGGIVGGI